MDNMGKLFPAFSKKAGHFLPRQGGVWSRRTGFGFAELTSFGSSPPAGGSAPAEAGQALQNAGPSGKIRPIDLNIC